MYIERLSWDKCNLTWHGLQAVLLTSFSSDVHSCLFYAVTSSKEESLHVCSEAPTAISQVTFNECQNDISINYEFIVNPVLVSTDLTCWQSLSVVAYPHCVHKIYSDTHTLFCLSGTHWKTTVIYISYLYIHLPFICFILFLNCF